MTENEQRLAAKQFAQDWAGRGDEKQDTQLFWVALLQKVYEVEEPDKYIQFELPVKLSHTSFIDGYRMAKWFLPPILWRINSKFF